jgi:23S rRNA (adenine1618-N6)-methyltransferase
MHPLQIAESSGRGLTLCILALLVSQRPLWQERHKQHHPTSRFRLQVAREARELLATLQAELQCAQPNDDAVTTGSKAAASFHTPASDAAAPATASSSQQMPAEVAAAPQAAAPPPEPSQPVADRAAYLTHKPNFQELADRYPALAQYVQHTSKGAALDFKDWRALHALTQALFEDGFGVHGWRVSEGRMVPTLPNRMNYVLWIADLLAQSRSGARALASPCCAACYELHTACVSCLCPMLLLTDASTCGRHCMKVATSCAGRSTVRGLDIGCGANCVYTLLGASAMGWHMTGIDTDATAIDHAQNILATNPQLKQQVALLRLPCEPDIVHSNAEASAVSGAQALGRSEASPYQLCSMHRPSNASSATAEKGGGILLQWAQYLASFDFCMCNPPFFEHMAQASQNPATASGGTDAEMACTGGEAAFVGQLIDESQQVPQLCHWFSSMLGKKVTFKALRKRLNEMPGVTAVRSSELAQGRTHRWVLAWSFVVPKQLSQQPLRLGKRCYAGDSSTGDEHGPSDTKKIARG